MFEEQKKQAERILQDEKLLHITKQIKNRLVRKEIMETELKRINIEIADLVNNGELSNLNDYIKIDPQNKHILNGFVISNE